MASIPMSEDLKQELLDCKSDEAAMLIQNALSVKPYNA
jgi:hypothetical protein